MSSLDSKIPLYVDLDGTLTKSDTLFEQTVGLVRKDPLALFMIPIWLFRSGKAHVKQRVAERFQVDASSLPYTDAVLELITQHRQAGGRAILATAASEATATSIAEHLGCFDQVMSSSGDVNLKGATKLEAIRKHCDNKDFAYIGNDVADFPIWRASRHPFVANGSPRVRAFVRAHGGVELGEPPSIIQQLIRAARPYQWLKNTLLFIPLFLAHRVTDVGAVVDACVGFIAFSFCASGVYYLNDILDIEHDRRHSTKRLRPFASGDLSIFQGLLGWVALTTAGLFVALTLSERFMFVLLIYLIVSTVYSSSLKQVVMLDVIVLAGLYTIRIIAGAEAIDVPLSFWLLAFSMFLFLSLALIKRFSEIMNMEMRGELRASGRDYSVNDKLVVGQLGVTSGLISILVLALYINSAAILELYREPRLIWFLCPMIMYWIGRMWLLASRGEVDEDPLVFAVKDRRTALIAILCGVIVFLAI